MSPHKIKQMKQAADQRKIKHYLAMVKDKDTVESKIEKSVGRIAK